MGLYRKILKEFEDFYFGAATLAIIAQSCLGSIAAMYILKNGNDLVQMTQLSIVVLVCMLVNGSILAQMKPKLVLNLIIASVISSLLFIFLNNFVL